MREHAYFLSYRDFIDHGLGLRLLKDMNDDRV